LFVGAMMALWPIYSERWSYDGAMKTYAGR
jgi:hypothetical protein